MDEIISFFKLNSSDVRFPSSVYSTGPQVSHCLSLFPSLQLADGLVPPVRSHATSGVASSDLVQRERVRPRMGSPRHYVMVWPSYRRCHHDRVFDVASRRCDGAPRDGHRQGQSLRRLMCPQFDMNTESSFLSYHIC